jgi:nucleotide-binding universal stress UspA family protein
MPDAHPVFKKALLGLKGGPTDELVIHLGCQLARANDADLVGVHVIEVDWTRDLADEMVSANDQASTILDRAEAAAESYHVKLTADLLKARDVAAALVDEAVELSVDAIILGLPYRKRRSGDFALGRTVPYVFQNAPCQVLVVRQPVGSEPVPVMDEPGRPLAAAGRR